MVTPFESSKKCSFLFFLLCSGGGGATILSSVVPQWGYMSSYFIYAINPTAPQYNVRNVERYDVEFEPQPNAISSEFLCLSTSFFLK